MATAVNVVIIKRQNYQYEMTKHLKKKIYSWKCVFKDENSTSVSQ